MHHTTCSHKCTLMHTHSNKPNIQHNNTHDTETITTKHNQNTQLQQTSMHQPYANNISHSNVPLCVRIDLNMIVVFNLHCSPTHGCAAQPIFTFTYLMCCVCVVPNNRFGIRLRLWSTGGWSTTGRWLIQTRWFAVYQKAIFKMRNKGHLVVTRPGGTVKGHIITVKRLKHNCFDHKCFVCVCVCVCGDPNSMPWVKLIW